jgi:hypothetical protein
VNAIAYKKFVEYQHIVVIYFRGFYLSIGVLSLFKRVNTLNWNYLGIVIYFRGFYRYCPYLNNEMVFKLDEGNYDFRL